MPKSPKSTRKQHWVPQFYLRQFADGNGRLWACRRGSDKVFSTRTEDICCERDLHEVRFSEERGPSDFYMPNYVEDHLSEVEARLAKPYRRLLEGCDTGSVDQEGKLAACFLISHLLVRHPRSIKEERQHISPLLSSWQKECEITPLEMKALEESGWRGDDKALVELAIEYVLLLSGDENTPLSRLFKLFASKRMCICKARVGANFISASTPYFIIGREGDSYEFDFAFMPLSGRYAAFFISSDSIPAFNISSDSIPAFNQLSLSEVDQLNQALLLNAPLWETAFAIAKQPLELAASTLQRL